MKGCVKDNSRPGPISAISVACEALAAEIKASRQDPAKVGPESRPFSCNEELRSGPGPVDAAQAAASVSAPIQY